MTRQSDQYPIRFYVGLWCLYEGNSKFPIRTFHTQKEAKEWRRNLIKQAGR